MTARDDVREYCAGDDLGLAQQAISALLHEEPGTAATEFAANQAVKLAERLVLPESRIAILSSFTIDMVEAHLRIREFLAGRCLAFTSIPYDQWYLTLKSGGELIAVNPQAVFLLLHLEDAAPLLARRHLAAAGDLADEAERLIGAIAEAIYGFRKRSAAPVVLCTFIAADRGIERYFDRRVEPSRQGAIDNLNHRLSELAREQQNVYVFDYAQSVTDFGRLNWFDRVKAHHVMAPVASRALPYLAEELSGFFGALVETRRKVLAVDLDGTFWGGIVGEDGIDGIALGGDYPGNAYHDFQAFLKNLRASGIALAVVSKNDSADAEAVFAANPGMPVQWQDFASHRVNWEDKAYNVRAVAAELNVGIDAITFADDSRFECGLMHAEAPEVRVICLDGPPSLFPEKVLSEAGIYCASLTDEDRIRADGYTAEHARRAQPSQPGKKADFLKSLGLKLLIARPRPGEIERVAQLFGKTNQFNLTTKRYTVGDVVELLDNSTAQILVAKLSDRYGDYGLIGVIVTFDKDDGGREIDSLLLSCRALGRGVEEAVLADLEDKARSAERTRLIGRYIPTPKNGLVADFYSRLGFSADVGDGLFVRDLARTQPLPLPDHIELIEQEVE